MRLSAQRSCLEKCLCLLDTDRTSNHDTKLEEIIREGCVPFLLARRNPIFLSLPNNYRKLIICVFLMILSAVTFMARTSLSMNILPSCCVVSRHLTQSFVPNSQLLALAQTLQPDHSLETGNTCQIWWVASLLVKCPLIQPRTVQMCFHVVGKTCREN